jgi:hypothetical protein
VKVAQYEVLGGRSAWEEVAPEVQKPTIFYRPCGTEALALRFPALRTGLLSNVPTGPGPGRSEHQRILP